LNTIEENLAFDVSGISVMPISVMHFKLPVLGFRIGGFTYITDANSISEEEKQKVRGSELLVINALQKTKHISHFTLDEALQLAAEIGAKKTYITHISHNMGSHREVSKELPAGVFLAYDGLEISIDS
ncbi:MAG: MBL fold metallo-hydrolase, partial [Sphingobacterium thalpophilum]